MSSSKAVLRLVTKEGQRAKATKSKGGRPTNAEMGRSREHLTLTEVRALLDAAKTTGRQDLRKRNHLLVLMMYRHGLRVTEAINLKWQDIDLPSGSLYVRRVKGGIDSTHPLQHDENRGLAALRKAQGNASAFVFSDSKGKPLGATAVRELMVRLGKASCLPFRVHPHQLRHSCGYDLVDQGVHLRQVQQWLGHKDIKHTVRYTELSGTALKQVSTRV